MEDWTQIAGKLAELEAEGTKLQVEIPRLDDVICRFVVRCFGMAKEMITQLVNQFGPMPEAVEDKP